MVAEKKRLDKKFIPTLAAIIVLVVLGILILPDLMKVNTPIANPEEDVLNFNVSDVSSFSVIDSVNSSYSVELTKKDGEHWSVNGVDAFVPDVIKIFTILKKVKVKKVINDYNNLKEFGLQPAVKTVIMKFKDAEPPDISFSVGDYAPASRDRYMKFKNENNIYLVDSYLYSALTVTPQLLENKDVFTLDKSKIVKLIINNKGDEYILEKNKEKWNVTLPEKLTLLADQNNVNLILANVFGNAAKALIPKKEDLKTYNLDKPIITVLAIDSDGKESLVKISSLIPSTKLHYIINDMTGKLYVIDQNKISTLNFNSLEIRNKSLITTSLSDIASISIEIGDKKYVFKKNKQKLWTSSNAKQEDILNHQFIENLSNSLIDITSDLKIVDTKEDFGFDNPKIIINAESIDKTNYKVIVGKKNKENLYFVKLDKDPFLYLIDQDKFDFITNFGETKKEKK